MTRSDHDAEITAMFDRLAPGYDRLNRILSLGRDVTWRRRTAALARLGPGETGLDVGVGTGDLAFELLAVSDPTSRVIGVDLSERMLELVRRRAAADPLGPRFEARAADAQALPFADASLDRVVAGFSVRSFDDLGVGLREMRRVLRPGGRAAILEFSIPQHAVVRPLYRIYLHHVLPYIAAAFGAELGAYRYLADSIERFPRAERLTELLRAAGFRQVRFERLLLGAVVVHIAEA